MIGQILNTMGVYEILYNKRYGIYSEMNVEFMPNYNPFGFAERYNKEAYFHTFLWNLLSKSYVSSELLEEVLFLLCNSNYASSHTLAKDLDGKN
jgi:hypothetical protein